MDISFQTVIRSVAGLDSIAQSAGRCNRNGEQEQQPVYLINLSSTMENLTHLPEISQGKEITIDILQEDNQNVLSRIVQKRYFEKYYEKFDSQLTYPVKKTRLNLFSLLGQGEEGRNYYKNTHGTVPQLVFRSSPKTVGKYFQVIDSPTTTVLVPYETGIELIAKLNGNMKLEEYGYIMKKAQQYMVNLFQYEVSELQKNGAVYPLLNGEVLAVTENAYDQYFGVDMNAKAPTDHLGF